MKKYIRTCEVEDCTNCKYDTGDLLCSLFPERRIKYNKKEIIVKYKGYSTVAEYDKKDKLFYGKIKDIKDLVTFEGDSLSAFREDFEKSVDDYIDFCDKNKKSLLC